MTKAYNVGIITLEIPVSSPRSFGHAQLKSNATPALKLDTTLFTLYYPAASIPVTPVSRPYWLDRPLLRTIRGYANFAQRSPWVIGPLLYAIVGRTKLNGATNQPLYTDDAQSKPLPFILFSHGLSGNRTTYSQYCSELASNGYIVAAVESRDGSGPISVVRSTSGDERNVNYLRINDLNFPAPHRSLTIDEFRKDQLLMRIAELDSVLAVIRSLNAGGGEQIEKTNLYPSSRPNPGLKQWAGRIDLSTMTMAGHSFGGATTLQVLRSSPKQFPFVRGLCLDPWVDPIPGLSPPRQSSHSSRSWTSANTATEESESEIGTEINVPLLVINSEPFSLWTDHFNKVRDIVRGVGRSDGENQKKESWLVTVVGSIHISFSDFPVLLPARLLHYILPSNRIDPRRAIDLFVQASLEFLDSPNLDPSTKRVLDGPVLPGDAEGRRVGEGRGQPMKEVGDVRIHLRPESKA